ncbi:MAG: PD-(D/E)XK nuclease family protein, partial [Gemmatimonadota bacterium]
VLEELHRELLDVPTEVFAAGPERLGEVSARVLERLEREAELWLGLPSLWRLSRGHLERAIAAFVAWDFEQLDRKRARPIAVEHAFGRGDHDPVRLSGRDVRGRPAELLLAGRIDRVDRLDAGEGGVRVVDYKRKGTLGTAGYDDGALLQSALYMRAWELLRGERPEEGLFLSVLEPGKGSRSGLPADRADAVLRFALSIPARVRAGLFEPVQAGSNDPPASWQPGPEITRTDAVVSAGHRFDNPAEGASDG